MPLFPPTAVSGSNNLTVTSVSTTYSVLTTDNVVIMSGASFTATLPTAVGVTGKQYFLKHNGTSLTQVYTIGTTSAQTIGGIAGGSYLLNTAQESLAIVSDGANWQITNHFSNTALTSYSPTISGFGTVTAVNAFWSRSGKNVYLIVNFTSGTVAATTASITMPTGLTSTLTFTHQVGPPGPISGAGATQAIPLVQSTSTVINIGVQNSGIAGQTISNGNAFLTTGQSLWLTATVEIINWQP